MKTELKHFSSGPCGSCPACQDSYGLDQEELTEGIQEGSIIDEGGFSWQPCELCGSTLGGNRYAAHYRDDNNDIIHLDICADCMDE